MLRCLTRSTSLLLAVAGLATSPLHADFLGIGDESVLPTGIATGGPGVGSGGIAHLSAPGSFPVTWTCSEGAESSFEGLRLRLHRSASPFCPDFQILVLQVSALSPEIPRIEAVTFQVQTRSPEGTRTVTQLQGTATRSGFMAVLPVQGVAQVRAEIRTAGDPEPSILKAGTMTPTCR